MTRLSKAMIGLGLLTAAAICGYRYGVEHAALARQVPGADGGRVMSYLAGFLGAIIPLALLAAYEATRFLGERTESWILQGGARVAGAVPEVEAAERLVREHQPLEAIRVLREFLQQHPEEFYVMCRIAEIYRDHLHNYLAAALEYEALLQHKLPDQQWGWAALHCATLYARLDQTEKSLAWLARLEREYGHTLAAKRARERLEKGRRGAGEDGG